MYTKLKVMMMSLRYGCSPDVTRFYGPDIAPDGETPLRESFETVVFRDKLENAVKRLNPALPYAVQDETIKTVLRISSPDVLANNEEFHRLLTEGIPVSVFKDGVERGDRVWLIDFNDPWNNDFTVVNQFTIIENGQARYSFIKEDDKLVLDAIIDK